jgi:lipopolysaccharide exporter
VTGEGSSDPVDYRLRAVRSSRALLLRYVGTAVASFVGTTALLRLVGPSLWAPYAVAYFLVTFVERELGGRLLGTVVSIDGEPSRPLLEAAARLMAIVGAVTFAALSLAGIVASSISSVGGLGICLAAAGASTVVFCLRAVAFIRLERELEYGRIAVAEVLDHVVFFALTIPLLAVDPDVRWLALGLAVRGVPSLVLVRWRVRTPLLGAWHRREVRSLIAFAAPGAAAAAFVLLEGLVPLLAIDGARDLGFFMTAAAIASYPAVAQTVVQRLAFPAFARTATTPAVLGHLVGRTARMTLLVVGTVVVPAAALASLWVPALIGESWRAAADLVAIICLGYAAAAVLSVGNGALYALGRPGDVSLVLGLATAVYLVGALLGGGDPATVALVYVASRVVGTALVLDRLGRRGAPVARGSLLALLAAVLAAGGGIFVAVDQARWPVAAVAVALAVVGWAIWTRRQWPTLRSLAFGGGVP